MYDKDGSGSITMAEMVQVFGTLYQSEGLEHGMAVERAERIFGALDIDNDGDITEEEFVKGCMADEEMVKVLMDENLQDMSASTGLKWAQPCSEPLLSQSANVANILTNK